jgi:mRNA interferase YafQ
MFTPNFTGQFKKDFKLCKKRNYDIVVFDTALKILLTTGTLPSNYKPHKLSGNYKGFNECHLMPDWLLIWKINEAENEIVLVRTGTHADLF